MTPSLNFGNKKGAAADAKEFLEDAVLNKGQVGRNNLVYLIGDVGVGKSTFINWLISVHLQTHVDSGEMWFIRLDLEELKQGEPIEPAELLYYLMHQLDVVLDKHPHIVEGCESTAGRLRQSIAADGAGGYAAQFHERAMAFCALAREIQEKTKRRLVIFLDNIDFICHWNDRGLYYDENSTGELHVLQTVCEFMQLFSRQRELGHLGANVFVVTRNDSYRVLQKAMSISYTVPWFTRFGKAYYLRPPEWKSAIDARCLLLDSLAERTEDAGTAAHFARMPKAIQDDLVRGKPPLIEHLMGLTNNGLRQVMTFFGQYGWIEGKSQLPGSVRLTESYLVGLMTFMLHRWSLYSQFQCRFPNFFLVNRVTKPGLPFENAQHKHSYWLKLLVAKLVASRNFRGVPDIVSVFTGSGDGYEKSIILECLGSLTDSHCSNCMSVIREPHPNRNTKQLIIEDIKINFRGEHCLDNIINRFIYLQLVVDEPYLPLPNCIRDSEFSYAPLEEKHGYSYVIQEGESYKSGTHNMVKLKARRVLLFLVVLEEALEHERALYPTVFKALLDRKVDIPNVKQMRTQTELELEHLNHAIGNELQLDVLTEDVERRREEIREELRQAYYAVPECATPLEAKEEEEANV